MNFFARGKLLISGEYLVLKGATALAAPLRVGQTLTGKPTASPGRLYWESFEYNKRWFSASMDTTVFELLDTSDQQTGNRLVRLLNAARSLNPDFLHPNPGITVYTNLEFNRNWGFGSSSSLIYLVAQWAHVNPFLLHCKVSEGSGYDVIAAAKQNPFLFTRTGKHFTADEVRFNPPFAENIFFTYLGRKQDSKHSVGKFLESSGSYQAEIRVISDYSIHLATAKSLDEFEYYLREHDRLMATVLNTTRLKDQFFSDLDGEIKPLGAWGGDFAMITWRGTQNELEKYLILKNMEVCLPFHELIQT